MTLQTGFYYFVELWAEKPRPREKAEASAVRGLKNERKRFVRDFPLFAEKAEVEVHGTSADQIQRRDVMVKQRDNEFILRQLNRAKAYHRICGLVMHPDQLAVIEDARNRGEWQKHDASNVANFWHNVLRDFLRLPPASISNALIDVLIVDSLDLPEPSPDVGQVTHFDFQAEYAAAQAAEKEGAKA
jgi:hypothetical protein